MGSVAAFAQDNTSEAPKGSTAPQGPDTVTKSNASGAGAAAKNAKSSTTTKKSGGETVPDTAASGEPGNPASHSPTSESKPGSSSAPGMGGANSGTAQ